MAADITKQLATLSQHSADQAQTMTDYTAAVQQVRQQWGNADPMYSVQYRLQQLDQGMSQATVNAQTRLNQTVDNAQQVYQRAQDALDKSKQPFDRPTLDSAWQRAQPILNGTEAQYIGTAMQSVAAQSPEIRAAVRDGLPAYLAGRLPGVDPQSVQKVASDALDTLSRAELQSPSVPDDEKQARQQEQALKTGMQNIQAAHNMASYALQTGQPVRGLPGFDQGSYNRIGEPQRGTLPTASERAAGLYGAPSGQNQK